MLIDGDNVKKRLKEPVILGDDGFYYFVEKSTGKIKDVYSLLTPIYSGFMVGQRRGEQSFKLINKYYEVQPGDYYYLTTMKNGPAVSQKADEEDMKYIFPNGEKSKGYTYIEEFADGRGLYLTDKKKYSFINLKNKKLKRDFYEAESFSCGYAKVRPEKDGFVRFLNLEGKTEKDSYVSATGYFNGFATVQKKENGEKLKRDMLGNLSKTETTFGKMIYEYYCGDLTLKDIVSCSNFLYDEKFKDFALMLEKNRLEFKAFQEGMNDEELETEKQKKAIELNECFEIYDKKSDAHFFR